MARSQHPTPDTIGGQQNIRTPFEDLQPAAKPFSVFQQATAPQTPDAIKENSYTQLAGALGKLQPTLTALVGYTKEIKDKEDIGAAVASSDKIAQDKNIRDIKQAQANGLLPDGASPLFIKAWKENFLKMRGEQADTLAREAYFANDALRNDDNPEAFNTWVSKWRQDYLTGILGDKDGYTGQEVANSKINETIQHSLLSLNKEHIMHRVSERERLGRENAQNLAQIRLSQQFENRDFFKTDVKKAAADIDDVWYNKDTGYVKAGGVRGSQATEDMTTSILTYAVSTGRIDVLDVANHIKTPGGVLAGTQVWREKSQRIREHIASEKYQAIVREDALIKLDAAGTLDERKTFYKDQFDQTKSSISRDKYTREQSTAIYLAPANNAKEREARGLMIRDLYERDPTAAATVQSTIEKMEEHATTVARTKVHDSMEGSLMQDILANPTSPDIERRIVKTFQDDGIDRSQMVTMLNMVDSYRSKSNQPNSMKDPIYEHLEKTVYSSSVGDISKVGGLEALEAGRAQFEFRLEALKLIHEKPELATNGRALAEAMEKRVKPIVERHNTIVLNKRKADEETARIEQETIEMTQKFREAEPKIKETETKLKDFDAGRGPNPNAPATASGPTPKQLGERLSGDEKKTLLAAFDKALLPAKDEKPITQQELRDTVRSMFKPHYSDLGALNEAVNQFIEMQKKSKRYAIK